MNAFSRTGIMLIVISAATSLHANGTPDENTQADRSDGMTVAQQSTDTDDSVSIASSPANQTVRIRGEDFTLIPAAPLEPKGRQLDVYFSDKVGNFQYERSAAMINVPDGRINAGFLFSEERDTVFSGSIMLDSDRDVVPGVRFSFGSRGYVALLGLENADVFGLSIGIEADIIVPVDKLPLRLSASYFYAPDILAFGDADRIFDWDINIGLQLRESFLVYTGVRYLQMDTRPGKREVDNKLHVGVRWNFG